MFKLILLTLTASAYLKGGPRLVVVNDKYSEYHRCSALLIDSEAVPGSKEVLTTLVGVNCPDKKQYEYIVGLPMHKLLPKE